eukprot:6345272-Amphidinium_carterae.1
MAPPPFLLGCSHNHNQQILAHPHLAVGRPVQRTVRNMILWSMSSPPLPLTTSHVVLLSLGGPLKTDRPRSNPLNGIALSVVM